MAELSAIFREVGMASILPFLRKTGVAFDDHATQAIGAAFDAACTALHDSGQPQIAYEVIAKPAFSMRPGGASGMSFGCSMPDGLRREDRLG